jgi:hypothetical protein
VTAVGQSAKVMVSATSLGRRFEYLFSNSRSDGDLVADESATS